MANENISVGIYYARLGVGFTVGFIVIALFWGRGITNSYPFLITLIPLATALFFVTAVLVSFQHQRRRSALRIAKSEKHNFFKLTFFCIAYGLMGAGICETIVTLPIERIHFFKYTLLGSLVYLSFRWSTRLQGVLYAFVITATIGITEETLQLYIPDRFFDFHDITLNVLSSLNGTIFAFLFTEIANNRIALKKALFKADYLSREEVDNRR